MRVNLGGKREKNDEKEKEWGPGSRVMPCRWDWGGDLAEGGGDEDEWRCARVAEYYGFTGVTSVSGNCLLVSGGGGA